MTVTEHPNMVYVKKPHPAIADLTAWKEPVIGSAVDTNASAGQNTLSFSLSLSDELAIITHLSALGTGTTMDRIKMVAYVSGNYVQIDSVLNPASNETLVWGGQIMLTSGDSIEATFYGCSSGDALRFAMLGYKTPRFD